MMALRVKFSSSSSRKFLLSSEGGASLLLSCCIFFCMSASFGTYWAFSSSYRLHPIKFLTFPERHKSSSAFLVTDRDRARHPFNRGDHQEFPDGQDLDSCEGRRVFMYELPRRFNLEVLEKCDKMVSWLTFCDHFINHGFGKALAGANSSWYATDPYMLEVIFHERMHRYRCLVNSPREADAFFIPYYAGLDALRFLYGADNLNRHEQGVDLVEFLEANYSWSWTRNLGHDHFMVTGRTAWDFASYRGKSGSSWGTSLRLLKQMENVTTLVMERRPWDRTEQAIPYPTSFHPATKSELQAWIERVKASPRANFMSFAGAPRPQQNESIRGILFEQCRKSRSCEAVNCSKLRCAHNPLPIAEKLLSSIFCLQPQGDTSTRRSSFDSLVCGCIPVFFHADSAYTQYTWHLPRERESYSVFIPEEDIRRDGLEVEEFLRSKFSSQRIGELQRNIRKIIPRLLYTGKPWSSGDGGRDSLDGEDDAFDVSVKEMVEKSQRTQFSST
ncbi:galactosyltransferase-like protein, partial [Selaginella moellendorffii]|eukprot:XP_002985685.1 probable xyloglucan galactosyltransferase GT19 [Selaginella moellendorffii]